jgi:hypothetical protein
MSVVAVCRTLAAPTLFVREFPGVVFTHLVTCIALSIAACKLRVTLSREMDSGSRRKYH